MINADKFKREFGLYATELWAMTEAEFLTWLNAEARPERKTGRWIYDPEAYPLGNPYGHYDCDQCGESVPNKTNYCPNCGAMMEVGG